MLGAARNLPADEGEEKKERCCQPRAETERGRQVHANRDAACHQDCTQAGELPHAVHEDERQIMCSHHDHDSRVEPGRTKSRDADQDGQREPHSEGYLDTERIHGVTIGKRIGMAHATQQQLGQGKNEKAADNKDDLCQMEGVPCAHCRRCALHRGRNKLTGESTEEGIANILLRLSDFHDSLILQAAGYNALVKQANVCSGNLHGPASFCLAGEGCRSLTRLFIRRDVPWSRSSS